MRCWVLRPSLTRVHTLRHPPITSSIAMSSAAKTPVPSMRLQAATGCERGRHSCISLNGGNPPASKNESCSIVAGTGLQGPEPLAPHNGRHGARNSDDASDAPVGIVSLTLSRDSCKATGGGASELLAGKRSPCSLSSAPVRVRLKPCRW